MPVINGKNGDWEYDITNNAPPQSDSIKIKFTPHKKAGGCSNIRLAQTIYVEAFNAAGAVVGRSNSEIYEPPESNPYKHQADDEADDGTGNKVFIDHHSCEKDPFYNGDDNPQDTASQGDATTDPPKPTELTDPPSTSFGNKKAGIVKIVKTFTTCAVCVTTGEVMGCISWKSEATPANGGDISIIGNAECASDEAFKKALKKFMDGHTGKKEGDDTVRYYCPETQKFGPPVPEGMKRYITITVPVRPGEMQKNTIYQDIIVPPGQAGGAGQYNTRQEALRTIINNPAASLFKFTWTGEQTKTKPSLLLCPQQVHAPAIAPFLANQLRMRNDFIALRAHTAAASVMALLAQQFMQAPAPAAGSLPMVSITAVGNFNLPNAAGYTFDILPPALLAVINNALPAADADTKEALVYLQLNMALHYPAQPVTIVQPAEETGKVRTGLLSRVLNFFRRLFGGK